VIALAIATRIPMSEWVEWGDRAIVTAYELLEEAKEASDRG
jgi:hypothetical protein